MSTDRQPLATISSNLVVDVVTASCRQERSSGEADGAVVLTGVGSFSPAVLSLLLFLVVEEQYTYFNEATTK